jgi:hypothetical protein
MSFERTSLTATMSPSSTTFRSATTTTSTRRNDIICYCQDYHDSPSKIKQVHMPWDPSKSALRYSLKFRLGDKPSFKEGGMLGPFLQLCAHGPAYWAGTRARPVWPPPKSYRLHMHRDRQRGRHPVGSRRNGGVPSPSHLGSDSPFPFLLVHLVSISNPCKNC